MDDLDEGYVGSPDLQRQQYEIEGPTEKAASDIKDLETIIASLATRVDQLEAAAEHYGLCRERDICEVGQLQRHLKQTIGAVKKLAQGKSLGALGLPSEEEWNQGL